MYLNDIIWIIICIWYYFIWNNYKLIHYKVDVKIYLDIILYYIYMVYYAYYDIGSYRKHLILNLILKNLNNLMIILSSNKHN